MMHVMVGLIVITKVDVGGLDLDRMKDKIAIIQTKDLMIMIEDIVQGHAVKSVVIIRFYDNVRNCL